MTQYGPIVDLYQNFETVQRDKDNSCATSQPFIDEELKHYIMKRKRDRLNVVKTMNTKIVTVTEPSTTSSTYLSKRKIEFSEEEILAKRKKFDVVSNQFQKLFERQLSQGFNINFLYYYN